MAYRATQVSPDPLNHFLQENDEGPLPERVANFLKTSTPADFNNCASLEWRYIIRQGATWKIDMAPDNYTTQNPDELEVLKLIKPEYPGT